MNIHSCALPGTLQPTYLLSGIWRCRLNRSCRKQHSASKHHSVKVRKSLSCQGAVYQVVAGADGWVNKAPITAVHRLGKQKTAATHAVFGYLEEIVGTRNDRQGIAGAV